MQSKKAFSQIMYHIRKKLPEIVVICFCTVLLAIGVSRKEGYHMDELLSFQLSNAEYNPWIVPTQPEGRLAKFIHSEIDGDTLSETLGNLKDTVKDVLENRGESKLLTYQADVYTEPIWISAEQFQDYIAVDSQDDFNYLSVYFNVKDDNHPPVHFMLLHTVASLFQGTVKPFMGCMINLAAAAVTMIYLMKIGTVMSEMLGLRERGRFLGIIAALLYGCSTGALASVLLIRMYCVVSMLCVILFYIHLCKWQKKGFSSDNKVLIAVTVLGFLTQYFFLFYCILLAAMTAVLLAGKRRVRELLIYVRSMLLAAVIGICCFPFAISDVLSSGRGTEALENLAAGLNGYGERLFEFWKILVDRTFGEWLLVLIAVLLCGVYVCRRCDSKKYADASVNCQEMHCDKKILWLVLIPVAGYFMLAARMSPYLVDRYIMPLFPFAIMIVAVALVWSVVWLDRKWGKNEFSYIICGVVIALQLFGMTKYDGSYLYRGYESQLKLAEEYSDYPCICVYDGVGYYENLPEFTNYEKTLLVTVSQLDERSEKESVVALDSTVVLVKEEVDWLQVCDIMQEKYGLVLEGELSDSSVYGDKLLLFGSDDRSVQ